MKKVYKISGSLLAAVLYSLMALLLTQRTPLPDSSVSNTQSTESQVQFVTVPADFIGVPLTREPVINLFSGIKYSGSDFQQKIFSAYLKHFENSISSEFVQFTFQAYNFPVKLRKADLLFPFHYFW